MRDHTTHAQGFALFVSAENPSFAASRALAVAIGAALRAAGRRPSTHHAERVAGEHRPVLDAANGVYRFDGLAVLRTAAMPAVLLEAGVIKHREEELVVAGEPFQADVAGAIRSAVERACAAMPRRLCSRCMTGSRSGHAGTGRPGANVTIEEARRRIPRLPVA